MRVSGLGGPFVPWRKGGFRLVRRNSGPREVLSARSYGQTRQIKHTGGSHQIHLQKGTRSNQRNKPIHVRCSESTPQINKYDAKARKREQKPKKNTRLHKRSKESAPSTEQKQKSTRPRAQDSTDSIYPALHRPTTTCLTHAGNPNVPLSPSDLDMSPITQSVSLVRPPMYTHTPDNNHHYYNTSVGLPPPPRPAANDSSYRHRPVR